MQKMFGIGRYTGWQLCTARNVNKRYRIEWKKHLSQILNSANCYGQF